MKAAQDLAKDIRTIQRYFVQRIVEQKYEIEKVDKFTIDIVIDNKYQFRIWYCNGVKMLRTYDGSFMMLDFLLEEKEQIWLNCKKQWDKTEQQIIRQQIEDFITQMLPATVTDKGEVKLSTRTKNQRLELAEVIETGVGQDLNRNSNYWLYNGYTRYLENQDYRSKENSEVGSLLYGAVANKREKAFKFLAPK